MRRAFRFCGTVLALALVLGNGRHSASVSVGSQRLRVRILGPDGSQQAELDLPRSAAGELGNRMLRLLETAKE